MIKSFKHKGLERYWTTGETKHDTGPFETKVLAKEKNLKQGWEKKLIN